MSTTTTPNALPSAALAEIHLRLDAVERSIRDILAIVSSTPNPSKMITGLTERLDAVEQTATRQAASLAGIRSVAEGAARTAASRVTQADLAGVRDMVIDTVGVVINEKQRDGRAALAGIASEIATAKAGSPSAQAASVIRAHLRQWAS